jgi:hypothetical protein
LKHLLLLHDYLNQNVNENNSFKKESELNGNRYTDYDEDTTSSQESAGESSDEKPEDEKRSQAYLRFGKSGPAYLRFGRSQAYLRFGKRAPAAYLRFGKRNPAYLRFGRK